MCGPLVEFCGDCCAIALDAAIFLGEAHVDEFTTYKCCTSFDRNIPRLLQPAMSQPMQGGSSPRRQRRKKWVSQFIAASQVAAE
jgi:hypothetical protein